MPVPYDFDYSGLVNAPYAVPPDGKSDVLKRHYMGYCRHNAEVIAFAASLRAQRPALLAALGEVPLDESTRRRAAAYLDGFFNDIADDAGRPPRSSRPVPRVSPPAEERAAAAAAALAAVVVAAITSTSKSLM